MPVTNVIKILNFATCLLALLVCNAPAIRHPSLAWRATLAELGPWSEACHASFPAPIRGIIVALLVVARSKHAHTRMRSLGLWDARTASLYAMFRWIGRLNYFECQP
jgi:hypothetical protein